MLILPVSLYRIKDNFQLIIYLLIEVCQPKTDSPLHEIFSIFLYKGDDLIQKGLSVRKAPSFFITAVRLSERTEEQILLLR